MSSKIKNIQNELNQANSLFNSKLFLILDNNSNENDEISYESDDSFELNEFGKINNDYFLLNDLINQLNTCFITSNEKKLVKKNNLIKNKFNDNLFSQNNTNNFISLKLNGNKIRKKNFKERKGDWVCIICNNLNFAFRTQCNKCKSLKENSVKKIF